MKLYLAWIFEKIFEKKKKNIPATVLFAPWLATYQWKNLIQNCNSVGAGAHKVEKVVSFDPTLTLILPIFGKRKKGKLYILKKLVLVRLRRYYENMYIINTVMFFLTYFYFAWKNTLGPYSNSKLRKPVGFEWLIEKSKITILFFIFLNKFLKQNIYFQSWILTDALKKVKY